MTYAYGAVVLVLVCWVVGLGLHVWYDRRNRR